MPIFFQQDIDENTKLAIWKIEEDEKFFLHVPLQREITHPHKRLQHLAGRYLLKYLFPDFPTELIRIADTRKPFLEDEAYHFSISHCGDYAAVIVSSNKRVGIDLEIISDKPARIMHKFLSEEEREIVNREWANEAARFTLHAARQETQNSVNETLDEDPNSKPQTPNSKLLTLFWSAKESMFKWWGRGQVDFSEMLNLTVSEIGDEGLIDAKFAKEEISVSFPVHYIFFPGLVLAWVKTEADGL